jgi:hypothetical protein
MTLESGTRVSLRYCREATRNTPPAALATAVNSVGVTATAGAGAGYSELTRGSGSFVTDGFVVGQKLLTSGFSTAANNGTWTVHLVTALTLTVIDTDDDMVDETGDAGNFTAIQWSPLRATARSINLEKAALESAEVDPDGQENDVRHGFNRVVGSPGYQLGMVDFDDMIEFAFGGTYQTVVTTGTPNQAVDGSAKTFTRDGGSNITDGFRPGDIIRTSGFSNTGNNGDFRVTTVTALVLTVLDPLAVMVTEGSASSRTVLLPGRRIDVSPTLLSYMVERAFSGVNQYQPFNGCATDQITLNVSPEGIIGGTINILGMSAGAMAVNSAGVAAVAANSGSSPFAAFDGSVYEGGALVAVVTSLEWTLARNRSLSPVVGSKFSPDVFEGTAKGNGTSTFFFESATQFNKFVNETESSIWFDLVDPSNPLNFHNIVYPRVKYMGGPMDPPQEGPVPLEMPFRTLKATGLANPGGVTVNSMASIQISNSAL